MVTQTQSFTAQTQSLTTQTQSVAVLAQSGFNSASSANNNQFYTPESPVVSKQTVVAEPAYTEKQCQQANTYWTGYRCACKVGYSMEAGNCIKSGVHQNPDIYRPSEFISKLSLLYTSPAAPSCHQENEVHSGGVCVCKQGYRRDTSGRCSYASNPLNCPPNSH